MRNTHAGLRPRTFDEYIGQTVGAREPAGLDHRGASASRSARITAPVRASRPGQTKLAYVIVQRIGRAGSRHLRPGDWRSTGDLAAMLTSLQAREVLFIDEIHR